ncbi:hypothetical protein B398_00835 [Xylella fastidiosa 32]|nr:hypothetical protein B398_00835 [Xylella fastidiosa 32]
MYKLLQNAIVFQIEIRRMWIWTYWKKLFPFSGEGGDFLFN